MTSPGPAAPTVRPTAFALSAATGSLGTYLLDCAEAPGYLDFARLGPPLRSVVAARHDAMETLSSGHAGAVETMEAVLRRAHTAASSLTGFSRAETTLASSTSTALMAIAFALRAGGEVIVPMGEFPANVAPWLRAAARSGPAVVRAPRAADGSLGPAEIAAVLTPATTAVTVSAVDYLTGWKAPLSDIRELIGPDRLLVVDAIQGLGVSDLDLEAADVVVAGGQKWLRAGQGAAVLAVRDRAADRLEATLGGWPSLPDLEADAVLPADSVDGPDRFLPTNIDLEAAAGLNAALGALADCGVRRVYQRQQVVTVAVRDIVRSVGGRILGDEWALEQRGPIVSFTLPGLDSVHVQQQLALRGLTVSVREAHLRISAPASFTDRSHDMLLDALTDVTRGR